MTAPIQLTDEQFTELLNRLPANTMANKNFTRCSLRFHGERDFNKVEEFVTAVEIYKKIENISDEDALAGLPLLLKDNASTWWQGVRAETKTWSAAIKNIRAAFAPELQNHEIYVKLFHSPQGKDESIDAFLCRKRALIGQFPPKKYKEEEQLDLIYGTLRLDLQEKIARSDFKSFSQLLERARHIESLEAKKTQTLQPATEPQPTSSKSTGSKSKRCLFCSRKGHLIEECRKRLAKINSVTEENKKEPEVKKPVISCYGCGAPGVFRSNCPNCKSKESPPKPVAFYKTDVVRLLENNVKLPTIEVTIKGEKGYAHIDTAARTSVASTQLYRFLLEKGTKFTEYQADVITALGEIIKTALLETTVNITLGNRTFPITLCVIPIAADNRTLLGIDFQEQIGMAILPAQRAWIYMDDPDVHFDFVRLCNSKITIKTKAAKKLDFENYDEKEKEDLSHFLQWANELRMVSPIPATPPSLPSPPRPEVEGRSPPKIPRWQLIKMDTPPRPTRPREPADPNLSVDPRIDYLPINPMPLYSIDLFLKPNDNSTLSNTEQTEFNQLLLEYEDIFKASGPEILAVVEKFYESLMRRMHPDLYQT
ncbi:hypothetical protein NE865_09379 [Phthorimaea operculella]|nr:hypothetical protein NE865_09379 [Phthorimaea operculella]